MGYNYYYYYILNVFNKYYQALGWGAGPKGSSTGMIPASMQFVI